MKPILGIASLTLLEEIFEPLIHNPFFVKDASLRYVAANQAMLNLCGVHYRSDLIGRTVWDIYPSLDAARYRLDEESILSGMAILDRVEEIKAKRGKPVWLIHSQRPLTNNLGTIVGVIGVSRHMRQHFSNDRSYRGFAVALEFIRDRFDQRVDFKEMAAIAGISLSQLERDFKKVLNVTPRVYQQRVRVEEAMRLMSTSLSMAQIAHRVGFSDQSSFSRRFKILIGQTPTAYQATKIVVQKG